MNDRAGSVPHFLRVVRALAKVSGPIPMLAVTTVVAGFHCKPCDGFCGMGVEVLSCHSDADCLPLHCLASGACGCRSDADCATGQICGSDASCIDPNTCQTDADCTGGELCDPQSLLCLARTTMTCANDGDCILGDVCDTGAGVCLSGGASCQSDGDCSGGNVCSSASGSLVCEPPPGGAPDAG